MSPSHREYFSDMKPSAQLAAFLLLSVLAVSCTRTPVEDVTWFDDLPPLDYYERIYAQDEENQAVQTRKEYLKWVVRFYKGWELYQDGWHITTRDVLRGTPEGAAKDRLERKLARLGKLISGEWAKNSDNRRIRSRELSIWGQALLKAINRQREEALVDQLTRDVDALLKDDLDPFEINLKRY